MISCSLKSKALRDSQALPYCWVLAAGLVVVDCSTLAKNTSQDCSVQAFVWFFLVVCGTWYLYHKWLLRACRGLCLKMASSPVRHQCPSKSWTVQRTVVEQRLLPCKTKISAQVVAAVMAVCFVLTFMLTLGFPSFLPSPPIGPEVVS